MSTLPISAPGRSFMDHNARALLTRRLGRACLYILMGIIVFVVAFPLFWMISTSFKPKTEIYIQPPTLLPIQWTLQNYVDLLALTKFPYYYRNSVIVATSSTFVSIVVGSLAAYALSRFRF